MKGESWKDMELVGMMKTFASFVDLTTNLGLFILRPLVSVDHFQHKTRAQKQKAVCHIHQFVVSVDASSRNEAERCSSNVKSSRSQKRQVIVLVVSLLVITI